MAVQSGSGCLLEVDFLRANYDDVVGHLLVGLVDVLGSEGVIATLVLRRQRRTTDK